MIGVLDYGMSSVRVLGFLLPFISILGIAGEFTRGQGRLGRDGFRAFAFGISIATLAFVVVYGLLGMAAVENVDRNYGFVLITFFLSMIPASVFAVIDILLHGRKRGKQEDRPIS